eukprot:4430915-Pyramimonas_sp.AAC.1
MKSIDVLEVTYQNEKHMTSLPGNALHAATHCHSAHACSLHTCSRVVGCVTSHFRREATLHEIQL